MMKKLSLMVAALGLVAMLFVGCKQNAGLDAPIVVLPESVGEDTLKGQSYENIHNGSATPQRLVFNNDGTFLYQLEENQGEVYVWVTNSEYRYTYDSENKILSFCLIKDRFYYTDRVMTYSQTMKYINEITKSKKNYMDFLEEMGGKEFRDGCESNFDEMCKEYGSEKAVLARIKKDHSAMTDKNFSKKEIYEIIIEDNKYDLKPYAPVGVSVKELYEKYIFPEFELDYHRIGGSSNYVSFEGLEGFIIDVTDTQIICKKEDGTIFYIDYEYDSENRILSITVNSKIYKLTLVDNYIYI